MDTSKVTRLEIINHTEDDKVQLDSGRTVIFHNKGKQIDVELQDDGQTLKIFIHERYE